MKNLLKSYRCLIACIFIVLFIPSCKSKVKQQPKLDQARDINTKNIETGQENNHTKELVKEWSEIIVWDLTIASICELGLHLTPSVCFTFDILGDITIIMYNNSKFKSNKQENQNSDLNTKKDKNKPDESDTSENQKEKKQQSKKVTAIRFTVDVLLAYFTTFLVALL